MLGLPSAVVQSLLSPAGDATFVFLLHTDAPDSQNRIRMSSTGEKLSKYSADDPRGARAVWELLVIGPELDVDHPPPVQRILPRR